MIKTKLRTGMAYRVSTKLGLYYVDGYQPHQNLLLENKEGSRSRIFNYDGKTALKFWWSRERIKSQEGGMLTDHAYLWPASINIDMSELLLKSMRRSKPVWEDQCIFPFEARDITRLG